MKHKTSELTGALLDAALAKAEGVTPWSVEHPSSFSPSADWSVGGPIIERERIELLISSSTAARMPGYLQYGGHTPLIAAMRAFVASKLGEEVEL